IEIICRGSIGWVDSIRFRCGGDSARALGRCSGDSSPSITLQPLLAEHSPAMSPPLPPSPGDVSGIFEDPKCSVLNLTSL
ncbi:hypothetical protein CRG98_049795, partial [Punica granatum]